MQPVNFLLSMPGGAEWLLIAFGIFALFFWVKMIIEIASSDFKNKDSKITWLLVTILLQFLGALIYYFVGRSGRVAK